MMRKHLQAFLMGIACGAVIGLLCAPKSGSRTRAMISLKTKAGKLFLKDQSDELRETVFDAVERGRTALRRTVEAGRRAFEA